MRSSLCVPGEVLHQAKAVYIAIVIHLFIPCNAAI